MNTPSLLPPDLAEVRRRDARDFIFAVRLAALAGPGGDVEAVARRLRVPERIMRAAVPATGVSDSTAYPFYTELASAWLQSLAQNSAYDAMLPAMRPAEIFVKYAVSSVAITAAALDEGAAIPARDLTTTQISAIEPRRVGALVAISREILRYSQTAQALIDAELRSSVSTASDKVFCDALIGVTSPISSTGSVADVDALLAAVDLGQNSRPFFIFSIASAKKLATARTANIRLWPDVQVRSGLAGNIAGIPLLVSGGVSGTGILVDANAIAAVGGQIEVLASDEASIVLDTAPTEQSRGGSPSAPIAENSVSMFQTSATAIRCQRIDWGFEILRASVASLSGVNY